MMDKFKFFELYNDCSFEEVFEVVEKLIHKPDGTIWYRDDGMLVITTGGWSENEELIDIISLTVRKWFVGYLNGGAYYYHENSSDYIFDIKKEELN